ncbi:MAG: anthranilate synthase component I family protein [Lysinibacillus sp.]
MNQTSIETTIRKFNGDSVSPILIYRRLKGERKFFMESSRQFEGNGMYSYLGANPVKSYTVYKNELEEINHLTGERKIYSGNPYELLAQLVPSNNIMSQYDFSGGLVGFVTYDGMVDYEEHTHCEIDLPAMQFDLYDTVIIYNHLTDEVIVVHHEIVRSYEEANIDALIAEIFQGIKEPTQRFEIEQFKSHTTDEQFSNFVLQAKQSIEQGEAVQLFLTKRFSAEFSGEPFTMYRRLRKELPAPNMFYFEYPDMVIMGVSPDSIIRVRGKRVYITAVTGARPRGATPSEDVKIELKLLQNSREVNAHNILVDSTMADLEEICLPGTIHLLDYMKPMQFKHSIRLTTEIEGILHEHMKPIEALTLLVPPATSSGVPKRIASKIVCSIEGVPRSFSGGVIGYISLNGNIDFTLLQQALVIKNQRAYVQAGANILIDTNEIDPVLEIRKKLNAFLKIDV